MIWKTYTPAESAAFKHEHVLPWAENRVFAFALDTGTGLSWLVPPPETHGGDSPSATAPPVGVFTPDDLAGEEAWRLLLRLYPGHAADIARYSASRGEIPADVFLNVLGLRNHYKNLADWRELGEVDESCRELARRYDFPINVLRLWNRLNEANRSAWMELWRKRNVRKNLIREIIRDFYDLDEAGRERALERAEEYSAAWKARSGHFPGEKLRDIVREIRYPRFETLAVQLRDLKKELNLPAGIRLDIPAGLESNRLTLELEFTSVQELKEKLAYVAGEDNTKTIGKILQNL